jgi:molecular chaperone GrpE
MQPEPDPDPAAIPGDVVDGEQVIMLGGERVPDDGFRYVEDSGAEHIAELTGRLAAVEAALTALIAEGADRAAARERVIERQHAEIERLRAEQRVGTMRPVVTDLCRLRNDLLRQAGTLAEGTTAERFAGLLRSFADSVEEALDRCGVGVAPHTPGGPFDPARQRVAGMLDVVEPERDGTVAEIVQDGYVELDGGRLVAPARIVLARATPTKENADG